MSKNNYRLYSFVNHVYMSEKQFGIQTAHAVSELSLQGSAVYLDWAIWDKTIIMCQGGAVGSLLKLEEELGALARELNLPLAAFREDQESLGGVITAVAVIVPERLWNVQITRSLTGDVVFVPAEGELSSAEHQFLLYVKLARLA